MGTGTNGIAVKSGIKAGKLATNHNTACLKVKSGIKGGKIATNHNVALRSLG